jgi:hypothetical protein
MQCSLYQFYVDLMLIIPNFIFLAPTVHWLFLKKMKAKWKCLHGHHVIDLRSRNRSLNNSFICAICLLPFKFQGAAIIVVSVTPKQTCNQPNPCLQPWYPTSLISWKTISVFHFPTKHYWNLSAYIKLFFLITPFFDYLTLPTHVIILFFFI